ncbi:MAG: hypothetical protein AAF911_13690 [Planctomycetota bacterium]
MIAMAKSATLPQNNHKNLPPISRGYCRAQFEVDRKKEWVFFSSVGAVIVSMWVFNELWILICVAYAYGFEGYLAGMRLYKVKGIEFNYDDGEPVSGYLQLLMLLWPFFGIGVFGGTLYVLSRVERYRIRRSYKKYLKGEIKGPWLIQDP